MSRILITALTIPFAEGLAHLSKDTRDALTKSKCSLAMCSKGPLVCRDEQVSLITDYLTSHLSSHTSGSLYISGLPGTGKTACIDHVLQELKKTKVVINCNDLKTPKEVFNKLARRLLGGPAVGRVEANLAKAITSSKDMM